MKAVDRRASDKKLFELLTRDEVLAIIAQRLKERMKERHIAFEFMERKMSDIVTLAKDRAQRIKNQRAELIDEGVQLLREMMKDGVITFEVFGEYSEGLVTQEVDLVTEALGLAIRKIDAERKASEIPEPRRGRR